MPIALVVMVLVFGGLLLILIQNPWFWITIGIGLVLRFVSREIRYRRKVKNAEKQYLSLVSGHRSTENGAN